MKIGVSGFAWTSKLDQTHLDRFPDLRNNGIHLDIRRPALGDELPKTLAHLSGRRIAAVVSSLPLLNQPPALRAKLIADAFALMGPTGVFVQFTYGLKSPIPRQGCIGKFAGHCSAPIWRNLPPAWVWSYRSDPQGRVADPMFGMLRERADRLGRSWDDKKQQAGRLLRAQRARVRAALDREVEAVCEPGRRGSRAQGRSEPPSETPL